MKILRPLIALLALIGCTAAGAAPGLSDGSLYSFSDLYRLAAGAEYAAPVPRGLAIPVAASVAAAAAPAQPPYVFSIAAMPEPQRGLLLLSGLAAAAWVARRRLGYSL